MTQFKLTIRMPDNQTIVHTITKQNVLIGRNVECDIVLQGDSKASSQHARIELTGNTCQIIDLESMNGVIIDGQAIQPNDPFQIQLGQPILIGEHEILLAEAGRAGLVQALSKLSRPSLRSNRSISRLFGRSPQGSSAPRLLRQLPTRISFRNLTGPRGYATMFLVFASGVAIGAGGQAWRTAAIQPSGAVVAPPVLTALAGEGVSVGIEATPTPLLQMRRETTEVPLTQPAAVIAGESQRNADEQDVVLAFSTPVSTRAATPTPIVIAINQKPAKSTAVAPASRPAEWDPRLDQLGITVQPAGATSGQAYWRLVKARWQTEKESGGRHHIFINVLDETGNRTVGQPVRIQWADGMHIGAT